MKYRFFIIFSLLIMLTLFSSCVSAPKEGRYNDSTYEELIKKHGEPEYDNTLIIYNDFELSFIDPNYSMFFTKEELQKGVQVRKIIWENHFDYRVIVWLKNNNDQWITFDSLEYNSKWVVF